MKTSASTIKTINVFLLCASLPLCLSGVSYAGSNTAAFLKNGVGSRALGMGGAFTAIADDASAAYWNPAGLGKIHRASLSSMAQKLGSVDYPTLKDVTPTYQFANVLMPLDLAGLHGAGTVGLSWISTGLDNIPWTTIDESGNIQEDSFNDRENAYILSYGRSMVEKNFNVGANLTMVNQKFSKVPDGSAIGYGLQGGLLYGFNSRFSVGLVLDSGIKMTWANGHVDKGELKNKLGLAYKAVNRKKLSVLASVDLIQTRNRPLEGHFGGEFGYKAKAGIDSLLLEELAFRAGVDGISLEDRYGNQGMLNENINWTMGAGFKFAFFKQSLGFDYAFGSYRLGPKHRFSFSFMFL
jgi:hypothetical protein